MMALITGLLASIAIGIGAWHLAHYFAPDGPFQRMKTMSRRMTQLVESSRSVYGTHKLKKTVQISPFRSLESRLSQFAFMQDLACKLQQAKIKMSAAGFIGVCMAGIAVSFILTGALGLPSSVRLLVAAAAAFLPVMYLRTNRARYLHSFEEQLPNALNMLSNSLRAGNTVELAAEIVSQTTPEPAAAEFKSISNEINIGQSFFDAIKNLHRRIGTEDVQILMTAVSIQNRTGGNLSEMLRNLEATIRERFNLRREIKVLSSEGKSSIVIMSILPLIVCIPQIAMNKAMFFEFAGSGFGKIALTMAITFWALGILWVKKIVKLEK